MSEVRDYKKLIDGQLSNKLNESFNLEVFKKIDEYIQSPTNDILLDDFERAFNDFFANTTPNNLTYDLTDSELYKEALSAAETKVKETEEQLATARKALDVAQKALDATQPATQAAQDVVATAQTTKAAAETDFGTAKENFDYLKEPTNNKKQVTRPDYLKNLFPTSASYKELTDIFKIFGITEVITINSRNNENSNIEPFIDNLLQAIYSKYQDKFTTFKSNLQSIKDAIKDYDDNPDKLKARSDAFENKKVNIEDLDPIIENMGNIMEKVKALDNVFQLNYVDEFIKKFTKYHEIIKKKNFKSIGSDNTKSIIGELKLIIDKANAAKTSLSKKQDGGVPDIFTSNEMTQVTQLVTEINSFEQKLGEPVTTSEARKEIYRKEIYDKISDLICQIILLFTQDVTDEPPIKVKLPNQTETDPIPKLARTFSAKKFKFDSTENGIKTGVSSPTLNDADHIRDFTFTLKNNDLQSNNFKNSKQLMEFFKIKWNEYYSADYLDCIEKIIEGSINTYIKQLKQFFDETKDNFKNIFLDLIINTKANSANTVDTIRSGTDYLANLPNIKYNWSNIIENLTRKDELMQVLERPETRGSNVPLNSGLGVFTEKFDITKHKDYIDGINDRNEADYKKIIQTIKSLIYFLFHKIGNEINETIEQVSNARSIEEKKKRFAYNDNTELFNSKLKIIVDEFLSDDDITTDTVINNGETIFFINDCTEPVFATNLTNTDYHKKKQKTKKLLEDYKLFVDESFYKILDETISELISRQDNQLINSDATKKITYALKISGERFLKKYNLVGDVDIISNSIIDMNRAKITRKISGEFIKKAELKDTSNPELKKFHNDTDLFTIIIDLLFVSADRRLVLGVVSRKSGSLIRGEDRSDLFTGGGRAVTNSESDEEVQQLGGRIDESISNVENTYNMIGGLKLDINPKFRRGYGIQTFGENNDRARKYANDPIAVNNFIMYFLEITFGLQILLEKLFSGNDIGQILTDFFSLYVKKLYKVLKPNISANTKLPIIVSNYSIYEITRKVIFGCFEKFVKEKILNTDTSSSADSSELNLSKDIILAKLSFSLPQLVDFFVDSFTNLDNLDNNILKSGSNNALTNYYSLRLGNIFNTSVEKKENFALISDELTKIFKIIDQDKKETNHLKFYREKIHKIDKIINDHQDETFGLLIEQIQNIIPGFEIKSNGLSFESKEFDGLTIETKQSDLEKRAKELQKELDEIRSRLAHSNKGE